jgi:hypothetical protein
MLPNRKKSNKNVGKKTVKVEKTEKEEEEEIEALKKEVEEEQRVSDDAMKVTRELEQR